MTSPHDKYPNQPVWSAGELSSSDTQYVREELGNVQFLAQALDDLGEGLVVGSSRTVYKLPVNQSLIDSLDAMLGAARTAAEVIYRDGLAEIDPMRMPLDIRTDELPEQFTATTLPDAVKGRMSPDGPIGYLRVESTEAGLAASVGALDPTTQTHYSVPLRVSA